MEPEMKHFAGIAKNADEKQHRQVGIFTKKQN
jgi:hypothetical protein